jgi:glucan phosphorylase
MAIAPAVEVAAGASQDDTWTGSSKDAIKSSSLDNLYYALGKFPRLATKHDYYMALAYTVRDQLLRRWISSDRRIREYCNSIWNTQPAPSCCNSEERLSQT